MVPQFHPRRGGEVKVGNVYTNPHGKNFYKIVVGMVVREFDRRPWNNVIMLHVNTAGEIVGSSNQPLTYISEHQDLVGIVKVMPSLKIEWFSQKEKR